MSITAPCPHCGTPESVRARRCRSCGTELLYDIEIFEIGSPKAFHQLITSILRYDGKKPFESYSQAKKQLSNLPARVVLGLPLERTTEFLRSVETDGVRMSPILIRRDIQPVVARSEGKQFLISALRMAGLAILLIAIFGGSAWIFMDRVLKPIREASLPLPIPVSTEVSPTPTVTAPSPKAVSLNSPPIEEPKSRRQFDPQQALRTTVLITNGFQVGSGFFVSDRGHILTNRHVIDGMNSISVVTFEQRQYSAEIISKSDTLDLALLKVDASPPDLLRIGDAGKLEAGETIYTIGNPRGLAFSVSMGIVSFVGRTMNGISYIQSDASINPGNSGGPMVNEQGEIVGINTSILSQSGGSEGLGFSLPINYAYQDLTSIARDVIAHPASYRTFEFREAGLMGNFGITNPGTGAEDAAVIRNLFQEITDLTERDKREQAELIACEQEHARKIQMLERNRKLGGADLSDIERQLVEARRQYKEAANQRLSARLRTLKQIEGLYTRIGATPLNSSQKRTVEEALSKVREYRQETLAQLSQLELERLD